MMPFSASLAFFGHWLRRPIQTAAVWPSSQRLADAMARQLPKGGRLVVELGGGSGAITRSLLRNGVPIHSLLVVEKSESLCRLMRDRFPGARILEGDACHLATLLSGADAGRPGAVTAVVSGLGLRSMSRAIQARIFEEAFTVLAPDGIFIQFTYGLRPPLDPVVQADLGLVARRTDFVLQNVPPASVYVYSKVFLNDRSDLRIPTNPTSESTT